MNMRATDAWRALAICAGSLFAEDKPAYTFGTTVVDSAGFEGRVYHLPTGTMKLPNLDRMRPVGAIYTGSLNIWPQSFAEGFPSVSDRFEWFAIEYSGRFWIEKPGQYRFSLLSDDGGRLKIDNKLVINNDGLHIATGISAAATLSQGVHDIRVEYFQGPRYTVALVLAIAAADEPWRIFNMNDFRPPKETGEWKKGKISHVQPQTLPAH
jgi:hypothetical protein